MLAKGFSKPTDRVERLRSMIVDAVPCIEAERAVLIYYRVLSGNRRTSNDYASC